jgi:hypothetical protein
MVMEFLIGPHQKAGGHREEDRDASYFAECKALQQKKAPSKFGAEKKLPIVLLSRFLCLVLLIGVQGRIRLRRLGSRRAWRRRTPLHGSARGIASSSR